MRKDITVAAEPRSTRGKNAARRTRVAGQIPAVLYGPGGDSVAVAVNPKDINKILHSATGHNTIFDIAVTGGEKSPVMMIDWLHHPVRGSLMHVDLKRIDRLTEIRKTDKGFEIGAAVPCAQLGERLPRANVRRDVEVRHLVAEELERRTLTRTAIELTTVTDRPVLRGALEVALAATRDRVFDTVAPPATPEQTRDTTTTRRRP